MKPAYPPPSTAPAPAEGPPAGGRHEDKYQFLTSALSSRGPNALPYSEDVKYLIRSHLLNLCSTFPSLAPRSALFTHNDGRSTHLLQVDGTVPIVHAAATYNLPAVIWLPETYPRGRPLVYLSPTRDMIIKAGHPHVDRSGLVDVPYLRSWVYPSSNLVELVKSLSLLFGRDPPLFSRAPVPSSGSSATTGRPYPTPPTPQTTQVNPSPSTASYNHNRFPPAPWEAKPLASNPASWDGRHSGSEVAPQWSAGRNSDDPAEIFRRNATAKLVETAQADVLALRKTRELEMDGLFNVQSELKRRCEELTLGVKSLVDEKEGLEQQLQLVLMNTDLMEGWAKENAGKLNGATGDVDDAFQPADTYSRQLLECTAADMAAEDTIYALDRSMQDGVIPFDVYLRSVRALSREQFFQRALTAKVRNAQAQAQAASVAARAPHYAP